MSFTINSRPAINILNIPLLKQQQLQASVLRLDEVHPVVSGNKWYKLKQYLALAQSTGKSAILTFGGAYSNHIVATAAACHAAGLRSIGIIRGEEPKVYSPTLSDAAQHGMQLFFVTREAYREKQIPAQLERTLTPEIYMLVGEGGYGKEGMLGAADIFTGIMLKSYSHIICSVGTGTTLAGLTYAALPHQQVIGISALKNNHSLESAVQFLLPTDKQEAFQILHEHHFGGYAKYTPDLLDSMNTWYRQTGIPSDFVYTGKMFSAFQHLSAEGYFPVGSNILLVHSGGLQGNRSLPAGTLIF